MITKVYIYETRKLNFLDNLFGALSMQGFEAILLGEDSLENNLAYKEFCDIYQHLSDNPLGFELSCFARYFVIKEANKRNDEPFIIADSDIYVNNKIFSIVNEQYQKGFFYGSLGYDKDGSEEQIAPHFSIWNQKLLEDFLSFLMKEYRLNQKENHLEWEFLSRKKRLGRTGISDMTMLYKWIKSNKVNFINTNSSTSNFGIDHNISSIHNDGYLFKQHIGRKKLIVQENGVFLKIHHLELLQPINVIHFQGRYKNALKDFYQGHYLKFTIYSYFLYIVKYMRSFF